MRTLALVALALACAGCPKDAQPDENDRLLQKLKAEQERANREGTGPTGPGGPLRAAPAQTPEEDPLIRTAMAAKVEVTSRKLPEKIDFTAGKLTVKLNGVETVQTAVGEKIRVSTNEQFMKVHLKLSALETAEVDLGGATLQAGEESFPLARDAQQLAGTRNLARAIDSGDPAEVTLWFELPEAAIAKGVTLKLPLTPPVEVPLQ